MIAGNDQLSVRGERASEHVIVIGVIGHDAWHGGGLHEDGNVQIALQQFAVGEPAALYALSELVVGEGSTRSAINAGLV